MNVCDDNFFLIGNKYLRTDPVLSCKGYCVRALLERSKLKVGYGDTLELKFLTYV